MNYGVHNVAGRTDLDQGESGVFGCDSRVGSLALHSTVIVLEDADGVLEAVNLGLAQRDVDVGQQAYVVVQPTVVDYVLAFPLSLVFAVVTYTPESLAKVVDSLVQLAASLVVSSQVVRHSIVVLRTQSKPCSQHNQSVVVLRNTIKAL